MKLHTDDPQFTAWLLGELPAHEAEEMSRLVAADPALQIAARQAQSFHSELSQLLGATDSQLQPTQRDAVMRAARSQSTDTPTKVVTLPRRARTGWWITTAAAAAIAIGIWVQSNPHSTNDENADQIAREISLLPVDAGTTALLDHSTSPNSQAGGGNNTILPSPQTSHSTSPYLKRVINQLSTSPLPKPEELPEQTRRAFLDANRHPSIALPLQAGTASWQWITRSIVEKNQLPSPALVRLEEMINAFPDESPAAISAVAATSAYKSNQYWVFITIANDGNNLQNASLRYQAAAGSRFRLCGFDSKRSIDLAADRTLPANTQTTIMLEIESSNPSDLGMLKLSRDGKDQEISLTAAPATLRHRHLSCIAAFGMHLKGEPIDTQLLSEQAQQLETTLTSPQSLSSLAIIRKALGIGH